jgi:hypothetical protein
MKKLYPFLLVLLPSIACAQAEYENPTFQTPPPPPKTYDTHAFYGEIEGPSMALSVNYDARFSRSNNNGLGFRLGIGYNLGIDPNIVTVPVGLNYLAGHGGHFFELGSGVTFMDIRGLDANHRYTIGTRTYDSPGNHYFENMVIGYRWQPRLGGFDFRAGLAPYIGDGAGGILPYLSFGFNF